MALAFALTELLLKREGALEVVKKLVPSLLLLLLQVLLALLKVSENEALVVERKGRLKGALVLLR